MNDTNDVPANDNIACTIIRRLNDRFRTCGEGSGSAFITSGVQGMGDAFIHQAFRAVCEFDSFTQENDPWNEHDFGMVMVGGEKLFWKIDYYNKDRTAGSEDPSNEKITHRVLTIMLAHEY